MHPRVVYQVEVDGRLIEAVEGTREQERDVRRDALRRAGEQASEGRHVVVYRVGIVGNLRSTPTLVYLAPASGSR